MDKKQHIHFIGIGGIGMSGIAKILKLQGHQISGCDIDLNQENIKELISLGCEIYQRDSIICESINNINKNNINILVYSSAISLNNPEILNAKKSKIQVVHRAQMLEKLIRQKYSIAVAGSHGKTTTSSLISHILIEAEKSPTVIIGGYLKNIGTNARLGNNLNSNLLVAEADESDRSLLYLHPAAAVITNIDEEHLDTYKDLNDIKTTFIKFLNNINFNNPSFNKKVFVCTEDQNILDLLNILDLNILNNINIIKYGFNRKTSDIYASDIKLEPDHSCFKVYKQNNYLGTVKFSMPGKHNTLNALAAVSICLDLDINFSIIKKALETFLGIERRFSFKGLFKGAEIFDDYGHHPTEIFNTLLTAKNRAKNKLTVIFQPHRFSRTQKLWNEFINVFAQSSVDNLIITDIYSAHEDPIKDINGQNLVKSIKGINPSCNITYVSYDQKFKSIIAKLNSLTDQDDLILTLGAGKVNILSEIISIKN